MAPFVSFRLLRGVLFRLRGRHDGRRSLRVAFLHPDLGIGGAERLVVDAAVAEAIATIIDEQVARDLVRLIAAEDGVGHLHAIELGVEGRPAAAQRGDVRLKDTAVKRQAGAFIPESCPEPRRGIPSEHAIREGQGALIFIGVNAAATSLSGFNRLIVFRPFRPVGFELATGEDRIATVEARPASCDAAVPKERASGQAGAGILAIESSSAGVGVVADPTTTNGGVVLETAIDQHGASAVAVHPASITALGTINAGR